ncbi:hypothetical protein GCM10022224_030000 [Nonomuraea antimicrobica]|uniref:NADPH-dependent reductive aminase-like C-terminal domain-containing protein n=1 Tax=Nonomuraea antimicrobica TaxID=561173 RepID=A0ABP7BL24_9ACTN
MRAPGSIPAPSGLRGGNGEKPRRTVLSALGGTAVHLGTDPGRAASFDAALLNLFWSSINGLMHSYALAARHQVPATVPAPHGRLMAQLVADLLPGLAADIDDGGFSGAGPSSPTPVAASLEHIVHPDRAPAHLRHREHRTDRARDPPPARDTHPDPVPSGRGSPALVLPATPTPGHRPRRPHHDRDLYP